MKDATDLATLWTDNPHTSYLPRRRPRSLMPHSAGTVITTPRPSWRDNAEARVRVTLSRMFPEDRIDIEGVTVFRPTAMKEGGTGSLVYHIGGKNIRALETAVKAVLAAAESEGRGNV